MMGLAVEEEVTSVDSAWGDVGRVIPSSWIRGADVGREWFSFVGLFFKTIERYLSAADKDDVDPLALYAGTKVSLVAEWNLIFVILGG